MSHQWYYADRLRQQQGPVSGEGLLQALQRGEIEMASLVWHDKLPGWVPLSQVAAELGLRGAPPPMPRRPVAAAPVREKRKTSGKTIAAIVIGSLLLFVLFFGGIIAAISIPAYNDYTVRSKIMGAYVAVSDLRTSTAEFYMTENRCPTSADKGFGAETGHGSQYVASVKFGTFVSTCEIRVALTNLGNSRLSDPELVFRMDKNQQWTESASGIPDRYLPMSMRNR
jgi:type IV pilus assembly protein PilA